MLTKTQINSQIKSIKGKNEKLRDQIHTVAVSIIGHGFEHGDATLATKLIDATKGLDRQALIYYFEDVGCFKWDKASLQFKMNKSRVAKMVFDEAYLNSEDCARWYDYAREKAGLKTAFDLEARVASLLKQVSELSETGEREVRNAEFETYLRDALLKYHLTLEIADEEAPL